ncbi:uncharacterized protein LOC131879163 [Tigriopus californicus]|uniref:uncharacterized protein LOC131879163 n=1 Tax=Tigriopus californicus TaxID=6832 RepID=UPI0027D9EDC1|nr:uncharacterized protein LOC131879163 [Tigriopus californicus]
MMQRQQTRSDPEGKCGFCRGNDTCFLLKEGENFENYLRRNQVRAIAPDRCRLAWHGLLCLLTSLSMGFTFYMSSEKSKYFIFLTNWGQILAFITYALQFYLTFTYRGQRKSSFLNKRMKTLWFFLNSNAAVSHLVALFYWFFIVPNLPNQTHPTEFALGASPEDDYLTGFQIGQIWLDRLLGHGLIPFLVWVDLLLFSTRPWRYRQCWTPVLFGMSWVLFSYIYYLLGGTGYLKHVHPGDEKAVANGGHHFIYEMVNWEEPQTLGVVLIIGALVGVSHLILCSAAWAVNKCLRSPMDENASQNNDGLENEEMNLMIDGKRPIIIV